MISATSAQQNIPTSALLVVFSNGNQTSKVFHFEIACLWDVYEVLFKFKNLFEV